MNTGLAKLNTETVVLYDTKGVLVSQGSHNVYLTIEDINNLTELIHKKALENAYKNINLPEEMRIWLQRVH